MLIETRVPGLSLTLGEDGLWVNIKAGGLHASWNLHCYAPTGSILDRALQAFCQQLLSASDQASVGVAEE